MKQKYPYQNLSLKKMKGEVWEDIPGFADCYQISNHGRIKSLERWVERPSTKGDMLLKERILKQTLEKDLTLIQKNIIPVYILHFGRKQANIL
jgi:NUMOD4 motif